MTKTKHTRILNALFKYLNPTWGVKVSSSGRIWVDLREMPKKSSRGPTTETPNYMLIDTKQYNILKRIWQSGDEGLRYTDIQMFIIGGEEQIKAGPSSLPHSNISRWDWRSNEHTGSTRVRTSRGHYSTWLSYQLPLYTVKKPNGKWILDHPILKRHFESRFPKLQR